MYTAGCWGPFPPHPAVPVQHPRYSQLPTLRFYRHTFPFSPSSEFPKARARRALLSNSANTGAAGLGSQGAAIHPSRDLCVWSAPNQIWVLCKEKILPLASEEQRGHSSLSQAAFRNSKEQMQNFTIRDKEQCQLNSLWHTCDLGAL